MLRSPGEKKIKANVATLYYPLHTKGDVHYSRDYHGARGVAFRGGTTPFRLFSQLITCTFVYCHVYKHCEITNCVQICSYSAGGKSEIRLAQLTRQTCATQGQTLFFIANVIHFTTGFKVCYLSVRTPACVCEKPVCKSIW